MIIDIIFIVIVCHPFDARILHFTTEIGHEPETLANLFPSDDWLRSYVTNKLRAHVFYTGSEEVRTKVAIASEEVLKEEFSITLKPEARTLAHLTN